MAQSSVSPKYEAKRHSLGVGMPVVGIFNKTMRPFIELLRSVVL